MLRLGKHQVKARQQLGAGQGILHLFVIVGFVLCEHLIGVGKVLVHLGTPVSELIIAKLLRVDSVYTPRITCTQADSTLNRYQHSHQMIQVPLPEPSLLVLRSDPP